MSSVCELWFFMRMIGSYEPGILDLIQYYMKTYTFKTKQELQDAVDLWCENRADALEKYGHISYWDVSQITDMSKLFQDAIEFNQPIGYWDVSSVTNMSYMFNSAEKFNQPIGNWDVSKVTIMDEMFKYAI